MVKADLSRDYYGDLDLQPGADVQEIKKQFKKLALTYHPDRNPGRESEVTAKFQKIQSAHEVLTDTQERAKYDANRTRTSASNFRAHGASSSGVRGNPWANHGSQWAPPPKAPTAKKPTVPPPSAGARRYDKFDAPKPASSYNAFEGAEARTKTYEAWENMKTHTASTPKPAAAKPGSGRAWAAPKPPPRETPKSGRDESNSKTYAPPPQARPAYGEFRDGQFPNTTPLGRSQSTNTRKGFMPNTPGGDEPAAPRGAYLTTQRAASRPPSRDLPPQNPVAENVPLDPLKTFREQASDHEPRLSTPYATHGGEKFNPFESANIGRSKSTKDSSTSTKVPRAGSDPNLASPHRTRSFADRWHSPQTPKHRNPATGISSDSDGDSGSDESSANGPKLKGNRSRPSRATNGAVPRRKQVPTANQAFTQPRKPTTNPERSQQCYKENLRASRPLNGFPSDGPPLRPNPPQADNPDDSKMYGNPDNFSFNPQQKRASSSFTVKPTVSENKPKYSRVATEPTLFGHESVKYPYLFPTPTKSAMPPSGVMAEPHSLNAFEGVQRTVVDQLVSNKRQFSSTSHQSSFSCNGKQSTEYRNSVNANISTPPDPWQDYRDSAEAGSPSIKLNPVEYLHTSHQDCNKNAHIFWRNPEQIKNPNANQCRRARFSFSVDKDTFNISSAPTNGFASRSAENITTKFTPEDWDGKFEAGADYFRPNGAPFSPKRTQSGTRSRGRSPIKTRSTDPKFGQPSFAESPMGSPSTTKFTPSEWAQTFKTQTFAPPMVPASSMPGKKRGYSIRPTMGSAAVVDDGESPEKPLFASQPGVPSVPTVPSPDAMDVDSPPVHNIIPQFAEKISVKTERPKRPAAASESQSPVDAEALKVNFDDLNIRDLITSLPSPPTGPTLAQNAPNDKIAASLEAEFKKNFRKYMMYWDLFNTKFMLHFVARKIQVDQLGANRWEDDSGIEIYRKGLRDDNIVEKHWWEAREGHEKVMKEYAVIKERMKTRAEKERPTASTNDDERPRKKTH